MEPEVKSEVKVETKATPREEVLKAQEDMKKAALSLMPLEAVEVVNTVKAAGVQPYVAQIHDTMYVYRVMTRLEWKQHLLDTSELSRKIKETAPNDQTAAIDTTLRNEDGLVIKCVLYPKLDTFTIKNLPAGYVETLANTILSTSGFNLEPIVIKL